MDRSISSKPYRIRIFFYALTIFSYIFFDFSLSENAGVISADRTPVYYLIAVNLFALLLLVVPNLATVNSKTVLSVILPLVLLLAWSFFCSAVNFRLQWSFLVRAGLLAWWIFSILFFYFAYREPANRSSIITIFVLVFFAYVIINLYARVRLNATYNNENSVLNYVYYTVVCIPFLSLVKNKRRKYLLYCLSMIITVFSLKRGAIIIVPLMLVSAILVEAYMEKKMLNAITSLFWITIAFILLFLVFNTATNGFLLDRFSKENLASGSGRNIMFRKIIDSVQSRDVFHLFFGFGTGSSNAIVGTGVHNDYLEVLSSYGLFGLVFFIAYIVVLIKLVFRLIKAKSKYAVPAVMATVYTSVISLYGTSIFAHSYFAIAPIIGVVTSVTNNGGISNEKNRSENISRRL